MPDLRRLNRRATDASREEVVLRMVAQVMRAGAAELGETSTGLRLAAAATDVLHLMAHSQPVEPDLLHPHDEPEAGS